MKRFLSVLCCYAAFWNGLTYAAISTSTAWEVRPTVGVNTSGGCFVTGSTGTDFSQQNAPQYNATDLAAVTDNTVSSATHAFIASDVGNCMQITAGTGFTTGFYQVVSVLAGVATLDRAVGTAPLTVGTYAVGGALATIDKALTANTASNKIFVKATGVLTITAAVSLNNNLAPNSATPYNVLQGYTSTRTDMGRASITFSTNTGIIGLDQGTNSGWLIQNFTLDCASLGSSTGIRQYWYSTVRNVKVSNCTSRLILTTGNNSSVEDSEWTGCTSACDGSVYLNGIAIALRNWVHDNAAPGIRLAASNTQAVSNVVTNNSGATTDGIIVSAVDGVTVLNNTIYASGRDGLSLGDAVLIRGGNFRNNILASNARYGFNGSTSAGTAAWPMYDGNFYFGNVTANRNNMDDAGSVNPIDGASPYVNTLDVILSANPFTSAVTNDFSLNNTSGGGAAVRGAGTPGPFVGLVPRGYIDGGALQHQGGGGQSSGAYAQ